MTEALRKGTMENGASAESFFVDDPLEHAMTRIARGGVPACVFNPVERLSFDAFSRRLADVRARRLVRFGITLHICQSGIVPVFVRVFDSQTEQEHGSCDNAVCETNWGMDYLPRACRPMRQALIFAKGR